jgi:hypothetical protein
MLSQHLRLNHFIETIQQMSTCLVSASIDLFFEIKQKNFPSVKKFHYFFTLNKMSILCQGLLHTKAESFCVGKQNSFIRLFVHEIYRVFTDRMLCSSDKKKIQRYFKRHFKKHFFNLNEQEMKNVLQEPILCTSLYGSSIASSSSFGFSFSFGDDQRRNRNNLFVFFLLLITTWW